MIDSESIRAVLKDIYGIPDKYLVPLDNSWYAPTYDKNDKVGSWIGYRILEVKPNIRGVRGDNSYMLPVKGRVRLSFVGRQAEALALQTLAFCDRTDCVQAFEKYEIQVNYTSREIMTYPIKEGGLNDSLCWFTDVDCQSFYNMKWQPIDWGVEVKPHALEQLNVPQGESTRLSSGTLTIHR